MGVWAQIEFVSDNKCKDRVVAILIVHNCYQTGRQRTSGVGVSEYKRVVWVGTEASPFQNIGILRPATSSFLTKVVKIDLKALRVSCFFKFVFRSEFGYSLVIY